MRSISKILSGGAATSFLGLFDYGNKFVTQPRIANMSNDKDIGYNADTFFGIIFNIVKNTIFGQFYVIFTAAAILYLMYAGIQYIQARSDPTKTKVARQSMINVIIAVILVTAAYAIVAVIWGAAQYLASSAS
jgi:hypothetical protein